MVGRSLDRRRCRRWGHRLEIGRGRRGVRVRADVRVEGEEGLERRDDVDGVGVDS
jgi:hypothetical protein